jgi:nitrate reductase NapA
VAAYDNLAAERFEDRQEEFEIQIPPGKHLGELVVELDHLTKGYGERAAVWLRPYHAPAEVPSAEYPFWLCTGRVLEHWHTGSMTRRVAQLHQAVPSAYVELNRADATQLGIKSGDKVRLASPRGSIALEARVDGRGQPPRGSVFVPFFDESLKINELTLDAMDNISKQPDYKKCAVKVERIEAGR